MVTSVTIWRETVFSLLFLVQAQFFLMNRGIFPFFVSATPSSNNDDASLKVSLASPPSGVELTSLCAPETSRGLTWNWTLKGDTQIVPCPAGSNGYARWKCLEDPLLNIAIRSPNYPDLSGCRSVWITSLDNRLGEGESILTIIGDLAKVRFRSRICRR